MSLDLETCCVCGHIGHPDGFTHCENCEEYTCEACIDGSFKTNEDEQLLECESCKNPKIKISLAEYKDLLDKELKLECLECNGVDNWVGYSDALCEYEDSK